MVKQREFSRRSFLTAAGGAALATHLTAARDEAAGLPIIPKRVEKVFKTPGIKEPNDLQFAPDGNLWILDQVDPNQVFKVNPKDGSILGARPNGIHARERTYPRGRCVVDWVHQDTEDPEG
jgi:hypothetical protein